jgi:hypothetical protein
LNLGLYHKGRLRLRLRRRKRMRLRKRKAMGVEADKKGSLSLP